MTCNRIVIFSEAFEEAGAGVHDVAADADIPGHEGMVVDEVDGLGYGLGGVGESVEPAVEVDSAVAHERDVFLVDAPLTHEVEHLLGIHALDAAAGVADDHDFVDAQLVDGHEERAHGRVKWVCDGATGVFNHFHVAVLDAEGCRKQLDESGVHTGDDCNALVGVLRCLKSAVGFGGHEFAVVFKDFVNHRAVTIFRIMQKMDKSMQN